MLKNKASSTILNFKKAVSLVMWLSIDTTFLLFHLLLFVDRLISKQKYSCVQINQLLGQHQPPNSVLDLP